MIRTDGSCRRYAYGSQRWTAARVSWAVVAAALLSVTLTVVQPVKGSVDAPIVGDIINALSVSVADAHTKKTCTTTYTLSYYRGHSYQKPHTECTYSTTNHSHTELNTVNWAVTTALAFVCGPCAVAAAIYSGVNTVMHPAAPPPPCQGSPRSPGCTL